MVGGEGGDQLWGSGRGAIACAIAGCQFLFHIFFPFSGPPISPRHPSKQQWILSSASCKGYTVLYIDNTKIGFGYLGSMLVLFDVFWTNFLQDLPRKDLQRSFLTMLPLQDHLAVVRSSTVRVVSITKSFETYISKLQWGISVITRRGNRWHTLCWKSSVPMTPRLSTTQYYLVLEVLFYCNKCILSAYFYF